jgi:hypothetical protein
VEEEIGNGERRQDGCEKRKRGTKHKGEEYGREKDNKEKEKKQDSTDKEEEFQVITDSTCHLLSH